MVMDVVMALGVVMMRIKIHEVPAVNLNRRESEWQPISIGPRDVHGSDRRICRIGSDWIRSDPIRSDPIRSDDPKFRMIFMYILMYIISLVMRRNTLFLNYKVPR